MATTTTTPLRPDNRWHTVSHRLLDQLPADGGPVGLGLHRTTVPPPPRGRRRGGEPALIEVVAAAGLRGRGGAGFPAATKMRAVASAPGPRVVVANGTEGEPASSKDAVLLALLPHLVLDGAQWAAFAVGADRIVLCVEQESTAAITAVRAALAERARREPAGVPVEMLLTPPRYVAGEESALVRLASGGPARPTGGRRPYERGVDGRPTLVHNVETLARIALIATRGASWFRAAGTHDEPGTALVTVSGAVTHPGVVEAPVGTSLASLIQLAGGSSAPLQAALVGGFFGTWLPARAMDAPFSRAALSAFGASPGAGVLVALPAAACGITETARILHWFAAESAGQCGPCVFGLPALAAATSRLGDPACGAGQVEQLRRWEAQIDGRGGCRHPDGAVRLLRSALDVFADDVSEHLAGRPCAGAAAAPTVTVPASQPGWR